MGAFVGLILAGLSAGDGLAGGAEAEQPPAPVQMFDASGRPIGNGGRTALSKVKVTGRVLDAETGQGLPYFYLITGTQDRERTGFECDQRKTGARRLDRSRRVICRSAPAPFAGWKPI
jgi:hypothetical protein